MEVKIDTLKFNSLVDAQLIKKQIHPSGNLLIWNYTDKCTYDKSWTDETMMARGLITDLDGNIVSRPFKKFFNIEEYQGTLPSELPVMYDKFDGSLGILYFYNDIPYLATRGSFVSEQANKGTEMLRVLMARYPELKFQRDRTYLFEIIYPQNKIVVDYGNRESLVLLAIIDNKTGQDHAKDEDPVHVYFDSPTRYVANSIDGFLKYQKTEFYNHEGFVLVWPNGFRIKMKLANYIRLHRLITGVTARRIWDLLRNGQKNDLDEMKQRVPEEFLQWLNQKIAELNDGFNAIKFKAKEVFEEVKSINVRADIAKRLKKEDKITMSVCFMMLDKKPYADVIWKNLRPEHERPFKVIE